MAQSYDLEAQVRTVTGRKVGKLRRDGLVPAIMYGAKFDQTNLQIPYRALEITLLKAGGTHLINLILDGKTQTVVAREVQRDPIMRRILHVDFLAVGKDTRIATEVPIHFIGESPAVALRMGILLTGATTLRIETIASRLMESIEIDISKLENVGDAIGVADLSLGEGVIIQSSLEEMIVRIAPLPSEIEEESGDDVSAEVEVIKKGKTDDEEDEG